MYKINDFTVHQSPIKLTKHDILSMKKLALISRNLGESSLRGCPGQKRARARASANAPGGHARQGTCSPIAVVSITIDKSLRTRIV